MMQTSKAQPRPSEGTFKVLISGTPPGRGHARLLWKLEKLLSQHRELDICVRELPTQAERQWASICIGTDRSRTSPPRLASPRSRPPARAAVPGHEADEEDEEDARRFSTVVRTI